MKRKHKLYSKPKRSYDKKRIEEEKIILEQFGLKNKKEIWRAQAKVDVIREQAKNLISAPEEEKEAFFKRLRKIGLNVNSIADVLSLTKEDYMSRRLQTVVFSKKIAPTIKSARQFITHKKIRVSEGIINSPSYIVPVELEDKIYLKQGARQNKAPKIEENIPEMEVEDGE
ncbi:MAG TPA: 30S ribosomal protein S4 [Patescibacteria group bacterium]|nr:30S ribosomal protein S4 [Patescibacteria group bacterium]